MEESRVEASTTDSTDGDRDSSTWMPPKRAYGMPDTGVATLEAQPDEEHARGPAMEMEMVAEWRLLRTGALRAGAG